MKKITTERLTLGRITNEKIPEMFEIISKNPNMTSFLSWNIPASEDELRQTHNRLEKEEETGNRKRFGIFLDEKIIGLISISNIIRNQGKRIKNVGELGYWLSPEFQGKGYMSEATMAVLEFGFNELNLHKITAACTTENSASRRIIAKLKMSSIGISHDHFFYDNRWWDMELFELLKSDWENIRSS